MSIKAFDLIPTVERVCPSEKVKTVVFIFKYILCYCHILWLLKSVPHFTVYKKQTIAGNEKMIFFL